MELSEAEKARYKSIEIEVMDHVYDEKEADGVLARDSTNIASSPKNARSESMENQMAGNNQSQIEIMKKYFDPKNVIEEEESFRYSSGLVAEKGSIRQDFPDYDDCTSNTNKMDQLLGLVESPVGEKEEGPKQQDTP